MGHRVGVPEGTMCTNTITVLIFVDLKAGKFHFLKVYAIRGQ